LKGMSARRMLHGLRACALVLVLSSAFLPAFTGGVLTRFGTAQLSMLLLYGGLLVGGLYVAAGGEVRSPPRALWVAAAVFCAAVLGAMLKSDHKLGAYLTGIQWLSQVAMLFAVVMLAGGDAYRRLVVGGLAATAFVVAAYGIHQYYVGLPMLREMLASQPDLRQQFPEALGQAFERRALLTRRAFGPFITPNSLGGLMLLGLPLCVGSLWKSIRGKSWTGTAACTVVTLGVLFALFLTKSKGAWLSAIIATAVLGLVMLLKGPSAAKLWFWAGLGMFVVILAAVVLSGVEGLPKEQEFTKSFEVRVDYWRGAWELIKRTPIVGNGLDSFGDLYPSVKLARAHETLTAHNDFLQIWAEAGIAGLVGFVAVWIGVLATLRVSREEPSEGKFPLNPSAAILVIVALGVVVSSRADILPFLVLWLPAGYAIWRTIGNSRPIRIGLAAAIVAYLIHSNVDMNAYVPGVAQPAWAAAGAVILFAGSASPQQQGHRASKPGRVGILIGALLAASLFAPFEVKSLAASRRMERAAGHWSEAAQPGEGSIRAAYHAIYELEKAIETLPYHDAAYAKLGAAYALLYRRGDEFIGERRTFDLAVEAYNKAISLSPDSAVYYAALGRFYEVGAQAIPSRWENATDAWSEAVKRYPTNPKYRLNLARSLREAGRQDSALGEFARALDLEKEVEHEWLVLSEAERREALSVLEENPIR